MLRYILPMRKGRSLLQLYSFVTSLLPDKNGLQMKRVIENPILNDRVTFIRTASETGGSVSELEISMGPGGGPPLHYHTSYTETYTAIEGEVALEFAGGHTEILKPGESRLVKIGEVHRFFNPTQREIRFRNEVHPGHEGFENALRILYGLATDGLYNDKKVPKDINHLAICAVMSDMRLPGLMALTSQLLKFIAARARRKGIEQELLDRYCR